MIKIKSSALSFVNGAYRHEGHLFSGIAYNIRNDGLVQPTIIKDGAISVRYYSPILEGSEKEVQIDISGFTEDDISGCDEREIASDVGLSFQYSDQGFQVLRNGIPFTGLGYGFNGIFCVKELRYENGVAVRDTTWAPSGELIHLRIEGPVAEMYSWYLNGELKSAQACMTEILKDLGAVTNLMAQLKFTEDGRLSSMFIEGRDLVEWDAAIHSAQRFPVRRIENVALYKPSKNFGLYGDSSGFEVFEKLIRSNWFSETSSIVIPSEFLTSTNSIDLLVGLKSLKSILLMRSSPAQFELAEKLKKMRPELLVRIELMHPDRPGVYRTEEISHD